MSSILAAIGATTLLVIAYRFISLLKLHYFTSVNMREKYERGGNWAVVTGASEGIGQAMALDLASRGFHVCVIARTKSKLDLVVEEIESKGVKGLAIPFDFSTAKPEDYNELFEKLNALAIGVLVNNVGVNYTYPNFFDEVDVDVDYRLLKVNCEPTIRMTKYVLPNMKRKQCGAIVFLGSFSAVTPTPLLSTYAATKSFNLCFGNSLAFELERYGIDVLTVKPNLVVSKMTQGGSTRKPKESFIMVSAKEMAHETLNQLGSTHQTSGHSHHALFESIFSILPETFRTKQFLFPQCLRTKKSAEKRLEKQ